MRTRPRKEEERQRPCTQGGGGEGGRQSDSNRCKTSEESLAKTERKVKFHDGGDGVVILHPDGRAPSEFVRILFRLSLFERDVQLLFQNLKKI